MLDDPGLLVCHHLLFRQTRIITGLKKYNARIQRGMPPWSLPEKSQKRHLLSKKPQLLAENFCVDLGLFSHTPKLESIIFHFF